MRIFSASLSAWSISSTRAPRWPATAAHIMPAAPAPITIASHGPRFIGGTVREPGGDPQVPRGSRGVQESGTPVGCGSVAYGVVRHVDAHQVAVEHRRGVARELLGPAALLAEALRAGVLGDAQHAVGDQDLADRGGHIALQGNELAVEPLARGLGRVAGQVRDRDLEFEL